MGTAGPERHELYARTQVVAVALLVAVLSAGLFLINHRNAAAVSIVPGDAARYAFHLDVNKASWQELALLPGLGPKKAQAIVARREAFGGFRSADDLAQVPGIGRKTAADIAQYATFGSK
jgi:competence ComEA-like helix-hairpin-helix protein